MNTKIKQNIEVAYDKESFDAANTRLWQEQDIDSVPLRLLNDYEADAKTFPQLAIWAPKAGDPLILNCLNIIGIDNNWRVYSRNRAIPQELARKLEEYRGFPIHIELYNEPTLGTLSNGLKAYRFAGTPTVNINSIYDCWLGDYVDQRRNSFYLVDYNGNPISAYDDTGRAAMTTQTYHAPTALAQLPNVADPKVNSIFEVRSYFLTKAGRRDSYGTTQTSFIMNDDGMFASSFPAHNTNHVNPSMGTITTRIGFANNNLDRNTIFNMEIVNSEVRPITRFRQITPEGEIVQESVHTIIGRVYDRHKAGFENTPISLAHSSSGLFEIPKDSNKFYNLIQFKEFSDNSVIMYFEVEQ